VPGMYILNPDSGVAGATSVMLKVDDKDIGGLELKTPRTVTVAIRVTVEDRAPIPRFAFSLSGMYGTTTVVPAAAPDGTLRVTLPEGEHQIKVTGLPAGYSVKSLTYGSTNLLTGKLKAVSSDSQSIAITLATTTPPSRSEGAVRIARAFTPKRRD